MKFYPLTMMGNGKSVAVNFENVTSIDSCNDNKGTLIHFSEDSFVCVKESFDEISEIVAKLLIK